MLFADNLSNCRALALLFTYYANPLVIGLLTLLIVLNALSLYFINKRIQRRDTSEGPIIYSAAKLPTYRFIVMIALFILAYCWLSLYLSKNNLDSMEAFYIYTAKMWHSDNFLQILDEMIRCAHQPLFPLLLNFIIAMKHSSFAYVSLRFFSVIFALMAAYLVYLFTLKITHKLYLSYSAFIFLCFHSLFYFYARRIETYSFFCFLSLLSCYYFWQAFIEKTEPNLSKYVVVNIVSLSTHYLTLCVIFAQLLTVIILAFKKEITSMHVKLSFLKALIILNFVIIVTLPISYLTLFHNPFIFSDALNTNFNIEVGYLNTILSSIAKIIFCLPLHNIPLFISLFIPLVVFIKIRKANPRFAALLLSILSVAFLYQLAFCFVMSHATARLYFNIRHFVWVVPFVVIMYSYGLYLLIIEKKIYIKIVGYFFTILMIVWSLLSSAEACFKHTTPAYTKSLNYIMQEIEDNDVVGIPVDWFMHCFRFNDESFYRKYGEVEVVNAGDINKLKTSSRRLFIIIPYEDNFGVPHCSISALNKYVIFLKQNLSLLKYWHDHKISVYLFAS